VPNYGRYPKATTEISGVTGYQEVAGSLVGLIGGSSIQDLLLLWQELSAVVRESKRRLLVLGLG
jgi:hypothetical protein